MQTVSLNTTLLNCLGGAMNLADGNAANSLASQAIGAMGQAATIKGAGLVGTGANQPAGAGKQGAAQAGEADPKAGNFLAAWMLAGQTAQTDAAAAGAPTPAGQQSQGIQATKGDAFLRPFGRVRPDVLLWQRPAVQQVNILTPAANVQLADGLQALAAAQGQAPVTDAPATNVIQDSSAQTQAAAEVKSQNVLQAAAAASLLQQAQSDVQGDVQPNGLANGVPNVTLELQRAGGAVSVTIPEVAHVPVQVEGGQPTKLAGRSMAKSQPVINVAADAAGATDVSTTAARPAQTLNTQNAFASMTKLSAAGSSAAGEPVANQGLPAVTMPAGVAGAIESQTLAAPADVAGASSAAASQAGGVSSHGLTGQIAQAYAASGSPLGQQITIRLNPPELGSVRLRLQSHGGSVRGVVEVDNARTLADIRREAPALVHRLNADGVQIKSMDVVMTPGTSGDASSQMAFQDRQASASFWSQQQGDWGGRGSWGPDSPLVPEASGGGIETVAAARQSVVSDHAINIWI